MKCLTYNESRDWLASMQIRIDGNRNLLLSKNPTEIMATIPKRVDNLIFFSARLADWLPSDITRMIWLSDWQTFPYQLIPFEKMRAGCGETRTVIDAPGHLFDNPSDVETAILTGFMFSIMAFNWSAYIIIENSKDYVYLGDEYFIMSSDDTKKVAEAAELINDYKLNTITDVKDAWRH